MSNRKHLVQSLRDFLNESKIAKVKRCPQCRMLMRHVTAVIEYADESWEIPLPFCPRCTAALEKVMLCEECDEAD